MEEEVYTQVFILAWQPIEDVCSFRSVTLPMAVIIPEAGGRFSNFDGVERPDSWNRNSGVATNGMIHNDLIGLFAD